MAPGRAPVVPVDPEQVPRRPRAAVAPRPPAVGAVTSGVAVLVAVAVCAPLLAVLVSVR